MLKYLSFYSFLSLTWRVEGNADIFGHRSLTVASASRSHCGCYNLLTSVPFVPCQSDHIPEIQFDLGHTSSKVIVKGTPVSAVSNWHISFVFTSGHPIDSCPFRSMTIWPLIPEIQFHGWPSTQPGTCTQPCPIVHTAVHPLFTQPCPGRTMSTAVCIYVAGLCASCPAM